MGAGVNGEGHLTPSGAHDGSTRLNLPSGRDTLGVVTVLAGSRREGQRLNLGYKIVTVARKGGTSHFLKYNQRPQHYLQLGS